MPGFVTGPVRASGYAKKVHAVGGVILKKYRIGSNLKATERREALRDLNSRILEWFEKYGVKQYDVVNILAEIQGDESVIEIPEDKVMVVVYEPRFIITGEEKIEATPEELDEKYKEYLEELGLGNSEKQEDTKPKKEEDIESRKNERSLLEFIKN